jgi:hypothetical protein
MDGEVEMLRALSDVPAATWDAAVRPGHATLLYAFLAPCDAVLDEATWRAFVVRGADGAIRAVSPGLVHTVRFARGAVRARVLELGPPCCPGAPVAAADPDALAACGELVVQAAWRDVVARGEADALMVREFAGASPGALERRLRAQGFVAITERPTFIAALGGAASFADYLGAMRAPYRRRAERYLAADFRVSITADFAARADDIARLCEITTTRAKESRRERVGADVVRAWARCAQARAVLMENPAGDLELAALVLEDPPVMHFIRVGFDADVSRATGAYPRLLYELVRAGFDRGLSFVDFGLTSADPKLRAGAQPVPLRVLVRHRNAAVQAVLRGVRAVLARRPAAAAPTRNVFRAPPADVRPHWYGGGVMGPERAETDRESPPRG